MTFELLILRSLIKIRGHYAHWSGLEIARTSFTICRLLERLISRIGQEMLQCHIRRRLAEPTTNIAVPTSRSIDQVCTTFMLVHETGIKDAFDCEIGSHWAFRLILPFRIVNLSCVILELRYTIVLLILQRVRSLWMIQVETWLVLLIWGNLLLLLMCFHLVLLF